MRLKIECDKDYFRHLLLYCFDSIKMVALTIYLRNYFESTPLVKTVNTGFDDSKVDFDLKNKEHSSQPKSSKMPNCRHNWMKTQLELLKNYARSTMQVSDSFRVARAVATVN